MSGHRAIRIDDPADPRIAGFSDIRERDLRRQHGQFIAEGTVVLRMLADADLRAASGFQMQAVLLLENRLDGLTEILANMRGDVPVYIAGKQVMNAIAGFDIHRGVLALGTRSNARSASELVTSLPESALVVAAAGISNHDNIGSIFRNAAAFGADAVLLDGECCDPLYRKAIRVSVGAALKVPYAITDTTGTLISLLHDRGFALWGLSPRGELDIRAIPASARMALLTGTEGEGLPQHVMASVRTARIAQAPGLDSLNAATATGIALYSIASAMLRI
ncbi:RNA methyltransferase [Rhizobium sp. KVB221]|uniref:RNA methyltransferase n=1 Tax=Rhizobium setariae TaxID=2801340 RepID=A0A936YMT6_9HYPH|nr:RNA methyltransferase [Rhizobium setariae]MBL0372393.1 RNA methyltransferase [Rhizobium setariae]